MTIEEKEAADTFLYKGTTYYFCSMPCKEKFDKNPGSSIGAKISAQPEKVFRPITLPDELMLYPR